MTESNKPPRKEPTAEDGKEVLFRSVKNSSDPHIRRYATYFLGQMKGKEEIGCLEILLRDPDKGVRRQAAVALASSGQEGFAALSGLISDSDWKVRYRVCEAFGLMGNRDAVPLLIAVLDDEKDHVRYMAAKSLGILGERDAEEPLISRINDENIFVRKIVAASLGKIGGSVSAEALKKRLLNEPSEDVKKIILESISQIG